MKKFLVIFLAFYFSLGMAQSDLRLNVSLGTVEADDPLCDDSFIEGYESAGGKWTGQISVIEYQEFGSIIDTNQHNNYDILTINRGATDDMYRYSYNSSNGLQYVLPAGSNYFRHYRYPFKTKFEPIICGSGYYSNITGYGCEFWDRDPFGYNDTIINIIQGGTVFNITGITRLSSTQIRLSITGNEDNAAGFEHGIPIRISGLTGTDISPLPSGLYYLSSGSSNSLYFDFTTTSGTLSTVQTPSAGIFKYGTNDNYTFIRTSHWNLFFNNYGYTIYGVTGFENNPNGDTWISNWVNIDGYGDKIEIAHNLGTGSYTGGGHTSFNSQSYATPYIAGKLSFIKDSISHLYNRECSWWEARYRARMTASGGGRYDSISGYGRIDVIKAINYRGVIPTDQYSILGEIGNINVIRGNNLVQLSFEHVYNATRYVLYCNQDSIFGFSSNHIPPKIYHSLKYTDRRHPSKYWYVAYRDDSRSAESEKVVMPNHYFRKIKVKNK